MPVKVLIVDDEANLPPLIRQIFRQKIRQQQYEFVFAPNGRKALDTIKSDHKIELVLTDINMPGMDGLTLLAALQTLKPELNPVLTTVIVSAYDDMENIRSAMNGGAFDFLTKPIDPGDLRATLDKTADHIRLLKKSLEKQRQAEEALRKINEELERRVAERTAALIKSNAELDAFAHTVTHDLKGPLSVVAGYADFLVSHTPGIKDEELTMIGSRMDRASHKAVNIIDELLLLASVRKETVRAKPLDMADLIEQTLDRLSLMIDEYKAEIILPEIWPVALGYAPWVEEVWTNYLSNGLKYGGQPPRLDLGATPQTDGTIRFWVRDNGWGLSPEKQARLFTEFTRLSEVRVQGHGLGLSIVQRIIEKLNGEVGVESEGIPGRGSVFYFTLPQSPDQRNGW